MDNFVNKYYINITHNFLNNFLFLPNHTQTEIYNYLQYFLYFLNITYAHLMFSNNLISSSYRIAFIKLLSTIIIQRKNTWWRNIKILYYDFVDIISNYIKPL